MSRSVSEELKVWRDWYPIVDHFGFDHLPPRLQSFSSPFATIALQMAQSLPRGPEVATGLRKLLEAKDCFVRAASDLEPTDA
jgi:hypothetical protein